MFQLQIQLPPRKAALSGRTEILSGNMCRFLDRHCIFKGSVRQINFTLVASSEKSVPTLKTAVTVAELDTSKCCKMLHQCTVQLKLNPNSKFMNCQWDPVGALQKEDDTEKQIKSHYRNEDSTSGLQHELRLKALLNRFEMFFLKAPTDVALQLFLV